MKRVQTSERDRRTRLMSLNRFLRLPDLQPPYSPSSVQKTDSSSQDNSNKTIVKPSSAADRVPSSGFERRTRLISKWMSVTSSTVALA
eukprot:9393255-Pyramimonas_sp.AAC.1